MPYSQVYLDNHEKLKATIIEALNSLATCTRAALTAEINNGNKDAQKTLSLLPALEKRLHDTAIPLHQTKDMEAIPRAFREIANETTYLHEPQLRAFIEMSKVLNLQLAHIKTLLALANDPNDAQEAQAAIIAAVQTACRKSVDGRAFDQSSKKFHDSIQEISFNIGRMNENACRLKNDLDALNTDILKKNQEFNTIAQGFSQQINSISNATAARQTLINQVTQTLQTNTTQLTLDNLTDLRNRLAERQNALNNPHESLDQLNNARRALNPSLDATLTLANRAADSFQTRLNRIHNSLPTLTGKDNSALNQLESLNKAVIDASTNEERSLNTLILECTHLKNDARLTVTTRHLTTYGRAIGDLQNQLHNELTELPDQSSALSILISRHPAQTSAFKPLTELIATFEATLTTCAKEWGYGENAWLTTHYGEINPHITAAQQQLHATLAKHTARKNALEENAKTISAKYDECNNTANEVHNDEALHTAEGALLNFRNSMSALQNRKLTDEGYQALVSASESCLTQIQQKIAAIDQTMTPLNELAKRMDDLEIAINTALNSAPVQDARREALSALKTQLTEIKNTPAALKQNNKTLKTIKKRYEKLTGNRVNFGKQILDKIHEVEVRKPSPFVQTIIRGMLIGAAVGLGGFIASAIFLSLFVPGVNVLSAFAIGAGVSLFCLAGGAGIGTAVAFFKEKRKAAFLANMVVPGQEKSIHALPITQTPNPRTPRSDNPLTTFNQDGWKPFATQNSEVFQLGSSARASLALFRASGSQSGSQRIEGDPRHSVVIAEPVPEVGSESEREDELELEIVTSRRRSYSSSSDSESI